MPKINIIEPKVPQMPAPKKVAAYARVSMESERLQHSLSAQVSYYSSLIQQNPVWEYAGVYADDGITGTKTNDRAEFNRMIADCEAGKIDIILTKSISRFARNTVDLSENCTWGQRKRFADGKVTVPFKHFLGYDRGPDGNLVLNPEEAVIVRRIYSMFLQGMSPYGIAARLTSDGIKSPGGKDKWNAGAVRSILTNEKYKGDALLQKSYTVDFLTKKKKINEGEIPQYYVEGSHEAIISPEVFEQVQRELERRKSSNGRHSSVHLFSGKIKCGQCGEWYGSKVWHSNSKYRRVIWQCNHKFDGDEKCTTPHLTEDDIKAMFVSAVNQLITQKDTIIAALNASLATAFNVTELKAEQAELESEMAVVSDLIEKCIYENAHVALDQVEYKKRYDGLTARFDTAKARYEALEETIRSKQSRMTVHGLVYDMTVKAAKEAALGAGANLHLTTAGILQEEDLESIRAIRPNLILLAGGTDYGERKTALENARLLRAMELNVPVIYAGNVQNHAQIRRIFEGAGAPLYITENVYPRLDDLNIEPARKIIHQVFEAHITKAPGMEHIRDMVTGAIMPTPGAVMECAKLLYQEIGDLLVLDVGGATTDIHSVTEGSEEIAMIQITPEPAAKRTVEGDLGVYVNAGSLARQIGMAQLSRELGMDVTPLFEHYRPIPDTPEQFRLTELLSWYAASMALERHCGKLRYIYGANGRVTYADGKDLTKIKYLVATGGALTRLPGRQAIMERLRRINGSGKLLYPKADKISLLEDRWYCMASLGVLSRTFPEAAVCLLRQNLSLR